MSHFKNKPLRPSDGRDVFSTLAAAYEVGVTASYFPTLAKRADLK